jgi:hypothetical protein
MQLVLFLDSIFSMTMTSGVLFLPPWKHQLSPSYEGTHVETRELLDALHPCLQVLASLGTRGGKSHFTTREGQCNGAKGHLSCFYQMRLPKRTHSPFMFWQTMCIVRYQCRRMASCAVRLCTKPQLFFIFRHTLYCTSRP